jgi:hypothetical protein
MEGQFTGAAMKHLFILICSPMLLVGCAAVPYDADTVYYPNYPVTVTAHASSGYYYPGGGYPYAAPYYGQPSPYYSYPYPRPPAYNPPVFTPPAPIVVPPTLEYRYNSNGRRDWHNQPSPHHDHFRNGPQPDWNRHGDSHNNWDRSHDERRDWQRRDWNQQGDDRRNWRGGTPTPWQQNVPGGSYRQK